MVKGRLSGREDEEPKLVCDEIGPLNAEGATVYRANGANGRGAESYGAPEPPEAGEYQPPADYEDAEYGAYPPQDPPPAPEEAYAAHALAPEPAAAAAEPEGPPRKLYLRFNDQNRELRRRAMAVLRVFHGTIPVILYDEATRAYEDAQKPQYVMHSPVLYGALRGLLGGDNVVLK